MHVLGVDPGASGALAMIDTVLAALVVADMPYAVVPVGAHRRKLVSETWLAETVRSWGPDVAWIERVHAMPKQGVSSSFSFGMHYGLVRGVLAAAGVPIHLVTPQEWKRNFRLGPSKTSARVTAAQLFPSNAGLFRRNKDDGRAEAALLALFGAQQLKEIDRGSHL